jgi:outer membrane immunogenic protein
MKHLFPVGVASIMIAGSAFAADMPVKAPPSPPALSWTGFYIGGTVGDGWGDQNYVNVVTTNSFLNPLLTTLGTPAGLASATTSSGVVGAGKNGGVTGGFEAGYNYQFESYNLVVGLETDIESLSGRGSGSVTQTTQQALGFNYTSTIAVSDHLHYLGTVRGRVGFLPTSSFLTTTSLLAYVTGGLAYGGASSSTAITGAETPNTDSTNIAGAGTFSGTRIGYTFGGGFEWMLDRNWTVKAEYLHYDLGTATYSNGRMSAFATNQSNLPLGAVSFSDLSTSSVEFSGALVRAGVNYKF